MNVLVRKLHSPWVHAFLAWVGLLVFFFFPVIFLGKVLAPLDILDHLMRPWSDGAGGFGVHNAMVYDAISQYLPYDWTVCQSLKQDGFIGWNPYVYGGYPLLENTMLCPGDWHHQLYRFLDFWTAWDLGIILQFAISGFGMLVMLRAEKLPAWAALAGAVCFSFYSQHIIWIYHRWVLGASCWFPWIVWAVRRSHHRKRIVDFWSVAFTALALRGGSLQTCLFVALLVLCLFLVEWRSQNKPCSSHASLVTISRFIALTFFSSLLFLDVFIDTLPAFLEGCRALPRKGGLKALCALPTLVTALHPTLLGTPQTVDCFRILGGDDLFSEKYIGTIAFILAGPALFSHKSPLLPKLFFISGLAIPFSPLVNWFYSRSSVVFALGCAWLFAWAVSHARIVFGLRFWRQLVLVAGAALALWTLAGIVVSPFLPRFSLIVHHVVEARIPVDRMSRLDWMLARADEFLRSFPIWHPRNWLPLLFVGAGLLSVWLLARGSTRRFIPGILVLCLFAEMFVWSRTWVTFSAKPDDRALSLYPLPEWAESLRSEMSGGGFLWIEGARRDFDFFQPNVQSGIGISSLQGYETIRPKSLDVSGLTGDFNPNVFAETGVSHVLVSSEDDVPDGLSRWSRVFHTDDFTLFRNPAFLGRFHAVLADGSSVPVSDLSNSPNRHTFTLPSETVELSIDEPYNRKWKVRMEEESLQNTEISRRSDGGICLSFASPLATSTPVNMVFQPKRTVGFVGQLALLLFLAVVSHAQPDLSTSNVVKSVNNA